MAQQFEGVVDIVGVTWSSSDASRDFVDRYALTFPIVVDKSAVLFQRFDVPMTPLVLVFDMSDDEVSVHRLNSTADLTGAIESALAVA